MVLVHCQKNIKFVDYFMSDQERVRVPKIAFW